MDQLGSVLGRIIFILGDESTDPEPILFCKLDIKDGFLQMVVPEADERQFCYVLPKDPNETEPSETMIVVPTALQMGWTSSPAFFCAATETKRDIAKDPTARGSGICLLPGNLEGCDGIACPSVLHR